MTKYSLPYPLPLKNPHSPYRNFNYIRPIQIRGSSVDLWNYQVRIVLNSNNFPIDKCKSDGSDIRFRDDTGQPLPYWIESWTSSEAVIWCKVPYIPARRSKDIWIIYGNPAAASASNGDATFKVFDDFESTTASHSFSFTQVYESPECKAHQSVLFDGTYYYTVGKESDSDPESVWIYKWDTSWSLVDSHNGSGDPPTEKSQLNGLFLKDGKLYIGAGEYPAGGGSKWDSWIVEYDPDNLSYITHHHVHHSLSDDYGFTEGCSWHDGKWWVIFGGEGENGGLVSTFNSSWQHLNDYFLDYDPGAHYQSVLWWNDYLFVNQHGGNDPEKCDCYRWNGSGFEQHQRIDPPSSCHQCITWDPDGEHTWWAKRTGSSNGPAVKALMNIEASCPSSSKWTIVYGSPNFCSNEQAYESGHSMKLVSTTYVSIPVTASNDIAIEMQLYPHEGGDLRWLHGNGVYWAFIKIDDGGSVFYHDGSSWIDTGIDATFDTWQIFRLYDFDWSSYTYRVKVSENSAFCHMRSGSEHENSLRIDADNSCSMYIDGFRVRKYASPEPQVIV